jgi:hypothetical protein
LDFDVINTADNHERVRRDRPARPPRRFAQPESTADLRPSQRRAEANRTARHELRSTGYWLRRFTGRAQ